MSGSPIIQNGRLIGAVTHVFVNDPTRGYGIFIEWMLQEGGVLPQESAWNSHPGAFRVHRPGLAGPSGNLDLARKTAISFVGIADRPEEDYGSRRRIANPVDLAGD